MIKLLMKIFPNFPLENNPDNWEIFNHENYFNSSEEEKKKIRRATCNVRYEIEKIENFHG